MPFSKLRMLKTRPSRSTPESVAPTEPTPPVSSVPPTTTEAMAKSSQPTPSVGWPAPNWAARMHAGEAGHAVRSAIDGEHHPVDRQPHQARRILAAADGQDVPSEGREVQRKRAENIGDQRDPGRATGKPRKSPWPIIA